MPKKPPMVPIVITALMIGCGTVVLTGCGGSAPGDTVVMEATPPRHPKPVIVVEAPIHPHPIQHGTHKNKRDKDHESGESPAHKDHGPEVNR
jgi:hypothetical protein